MAIPENKFNLTEQQLFDHAFPPAKVEAFEQGAVDDWVDVFVALKAFGAPEIKPEGKKLVLEQLFSHNRYGSKIISHETQSGLKVYRRNITPLLKASLDVIINCIDQWTQEQTGPINAEFSRQTSHISRAEEDWRR